MQRYPLTAATMARPAPVFPAVASMIVPPGRNTPRRSASSIMRSATRSFTLPPGLRNSTLASNVTGAPSVTLDSRINGVRPMTSRTLL